jgi:hypothetical protein
MTRAPFVMCGLGIGLRARDSRPHDTTLGWRCEPRLNKLHHPFSMKRPRTWPSSTGITREEQDVFAFESQQ